HRDSETHDQIAAASPADPAEALSPQADFRANRRARRDRDLLVPLERGNHDSSAQHQRRIGKHKFENDVVLFALEDFVRGHVKNDVKASGGAAVAARITFSREAKPRSGLGAGGNSDRQRARRALATFPAARRARFFDHRPFAAAATAGACNHQEALGEALSPSSAAGAAGFGSRSLRGAGSSALRARFHARDHHRGLQTEGGVLERDLHAIDEVASGRPLRGSRAATAAAEPEDLSEEIGEVREDRWVEAAEAAGRGGADAGVAELVVP